MVVEAHCIGTEEVEVVESIRGFEEWLDVGLLGDDDHVKDIVRKNQPSQVDSDDLQQIIKEMRLRKRGTSDPLV